MEYVFSQNLNAVRVSFVQVDMFASIKVAFLVVYQTRIVQTQANVCLEFVIKSFVRKIQIALRHYTVIQDYADHLIDASLTLIVLLKWFVRSFQTVGVSFALMDLHALVNHP